jgi:hypothetical protein
VVLVGNRSSRTSSCNNSNTHDGNERKKFRSIIRKKIRELKGPTDYRPVINSILDALGNENELIEGSMKDLNADLPTYAGAQLISYLSSDSL